ncbi:Autophagy-related protein-like protein [Emericellopsis cladophorae]|uniref:Autophagy-related protein 2 n=1 Tax=Emericellopsis cladophorae TaxID=2686198 RepID=A0A9Q0BH98_9HYPO|nr:Autophagy-related protein-like protein [Emericellopsis cladophorae]KAI6784189.1 Autophagy-related protein-like protein [Emericellopsis cladophorae]
MATLFQSFRSSSMPKRLLRYALARLELLDTDALNMENLDFALGRNTVFEFRDVGIRLKKLENLLKLPPALRLRKARVILLRVTIPVDFYTSPIVIEVEGVDVRLQILGTELEKGPASDDRTPVEETIVPNAADFAQSFLEGQPQLERQELENALAIETQDLGASVTVSDDGSGEEDTLGTGQALSLPWFLADFLQGIMDRMQLKINGVTFQLDVDVPLDPSSSRPEAVSFQVALQHISVEGMTAASEVQGEPAAIQHKEGKRHVSLRDVRAYIISEANVFSALAQSPSVTSPSGTSSPYMTRNPPSREPTFADNDELRNSLSSENRPPSDPDSPLEDSEDALGIPYDNPPTSGGYEDEGPSTPRASAYYGSDGSPVESMFHTTVLPGDRMAHSTAALDDEAPVWASAQLPPSRGGSPLDSSFGEPMAMSLLFDQDSTPGDDHEEDLTQSRIYGSEEAQSMYMSAFSAEDPFLSADAQATARLDTEAVPMVKEDESSLHGQSSHHRRDLMPGCWEDEEETSINEGPATPEPLEKSEEDEKPLDPPGNLDSGRASPSRAAFEQSTDADEAATPKGPTKLVKELLSLEQISVYIPSQHEHIEIQPASAESVSSLGQSMSRSFIPSAPGAYSVHHARSPAQGPEPENRDKSQKSDDTLEIDVSPIAIQCDMSLGFLLSTVVNRLLGMLKSSPAAPSKQEPERTKQAKSQEISVKLESVSLDFVSLLGGISDVAHRHLDPGAFSLDKDVLLNMTLKDLHIATTHGSPLVTNDKMTPAEKTKTSTYIGLKTFQFGYPTSHIVSFDKTQPMSTSVRDTFAASGRDIEITLTQLGLNTSIEVLTLPVVVQLDLQKLDETFGWFGGLSSFLNMSSSMTSAQSPIVKQEKPKPKARGVRFEAPLEPGHKAAIAESKFNVRFGGSSIRLVGKECSVVARSSAVKIIARENAIGAGISDFRLDGPYLSSSKADPTFSTRLETIRVEFLSIPTEDDLTRLLGLITPSTAHFDRENDEIMVDTLLRQRRKGSVLRASVDTMTVDVKNVAQLSVLPSLGEDLAKLSTVAKYLPEDDRPGLLTMAKVHKLKATADSGGELGLFELAAERLDVAHISFPSLVAGSVCGLCIKRNRVEELVRCPADESSGPDQGPVAMMRIIGDEIEPVIKLKLHRAGLEYRVPFVMDILGLKEDATPQEFEAGLAASVANLGEQAQMALKNPSDSGGKSVATKPTTLDIGLYDCIVGLNPLGSPARMLLALTDANVQVVLPKDQETHAVVNLNKASVLLIDDVQQLTAGRAQCKTHRRATSTASQQVSDLCAQGFADICYVSSLSIVVNVRSGPEESQVEVDMTNQLVVLQTCADSTQTLITLVNALKPPTPPTREIKYRTSVVPIEEMLASISGEAFGKPEGEYDFDQDFAGAQELAGSSSDIEFGSEGSMPVASKYFDEIEDVDAGEEMFDALKSSGLSLGTSVQEDQADVSFQGLESQNGTASHSSAESLSIRDDFYEQVPSGRHDIAKIWDSRTNQMEPALQQTVERCPLKLVVRDAGVVWNLFDGYDWVHTRDVITHAVEEIEHRAMERQARMQPLEQEQEDDDEEAIADFLFNSIYIGVSADQDPQELTRAINQELNDNATTTETESVAATTMTGASDRTIRQTHQKPRRLKLKRSRHHKISFELHGINAHLFAYPPESSSTETSMDIRITDLDIIDQVPTSTWRKFATYDRDAGPRSAKSSMLHLDLLSVKPVRELPVAEFVLRVEVLPVRLHVDQDALDFITRFFEFKDDRAPVHASESDIPFVQRAEVLPIPVQLDFKPKRVDYAGLRSGHTSEFMNFVTLDQANLVLRHVILHGVPGFDRLGKTLNGIWTPDVIKEQLPGVLAGLAPVRSLVTIGGGFRDLVEIPIKEYKKDGRVLRSFSKGANAFVRTTGTEIIKLGAKIAIGTQYALQGAEGFLTDQEQQQRQSEGHWEEDDFEAPEESRQISLYAHPAPNVMQGFKGGYRSLARDIETARDAIIAVPGEVMQSQNAGGAAKAVWKRAPTIIFRPAVGVTKVIGQTLMGATNTIDPEHRRRVEDKYKR